MSYWKLLSGSAIHRDMGGMPNLQGVSIQLGRPAWFLPVAALAVAAAVVWISARSRNTDAALAAGLAGSYLLSYHAYPQDALTLLMAFALLPREGLRGWRRAAWHLLASPVPLACALLGAPWHMVLPVTATVALAGLVGAQSMLRGAARERGGMPNRQEVCQPAPCPPRFLDILSLRAESLVDASRTNPPEPPARWRRNAPIDALRCLRMVIQFRFPRLRPWLWLPWQDCGAGSSALPNPPLPPRRDGFRGIGLPWRAMSFSALDQGGLNLFHASRGRLRPLLTARGSET